MAWEFSSAPPQGVTPPPGGWTFTPSAPPPASPPPAAAPKAALSPTAAITGPMPPQGTPETRAAEYRGLRERLPWYLQGLVPQSAGEVATHIVQGAIPGGGVVRPVLRGLGAAATGTGVDVALGKPPAETAAQHGISALGGEAVGGLGRMLGRGIAAAGDKTVPYLTAIANRVMPTLQGATPKDTLARIYDGRAQQAISQEFKDSVAGLFKTYGDPAVLVPSLERLPGQASRQGMYAASEAMQAIQDLSRGVYKGQGAPGQTLTAGQYATLLKQAKDELESGLSTQGWGLRGLVELHDAQNAYSVGKSVIRLFHDARERSTPKQLAKSVGPGGEPKVSDIQGSFQAQRGRLEKALGPQLTQEVAEALRIDPTNPLARDVPGKIPNVNFHWGFWPTVSGLPHAPRRTMEGVKPEVASKIGRYLGTRGLEEPLGSILGEE